MSYWTNLPRVVAAELAGTFLLVLFGTMVAVTATIGAPIAGVPLGSLAVALAFGLTLAALASALGHVSGGHFNPAVTIALAVNGKFPLKYLPFYLIAQLGGALLASWSLLQVVGEPAKAAALGATQPADGVSMWGLFLIEAVVTFVLMLVIVSMTSDDRASGPAGVPIGLALAIGVLVAGPFTGGAVNPARALGPMWVSGSMDSWYMYVAGPVVGAVVAAVFYDVVLRSAEAPS